MLALFFAVVMAFRLGMEALTHKLPHEPPIQFLAHAGGAAIVLATYTLLVRLGEDRHQTELSIKAAPLGLLAGLAAGFLMFSGVMAIQIGFHFYDFAYHGPASAWRSAGLAIESGVLEEVLVRGVLLRLAWRAFGPWLALLLSAVLFGAGHIGNPGATAFTTACIAIEAGVMLGSFYALTGRLWVSIGLHAGWNFTQGYLFGATVSGSKFGEAIARNTARADLPHWLTGGAFGPEASLPALTVCTVVGGATLWVAWRAGRFSKHAQPNPSSFLSEQLLKDR